MASEQNKDYFNKLASSYDSRHEKTLNRVLEEIRARLDFIGVDWVSDEGSDESDADGEKKGDAAASDSAAPKKQVRLLDYACGTGLVSRALAPYTTQCVGIDLSENMVEAYNTRVENQGLAEDEMHAYQGNLCVPSDPNPEALAASNFFNFDIAAVGLGFHHFDDPALAAQRLVERLKPGGVLLVLDFLSHDKIQHAHHEASHTVTHHGFSKEEMERMFTDAGAGKDFALQSVGVVFNFKADDHEGTKRQIFLARGTKL